LIAETLARSDEPTRQYVESMLGANANDPAVAARLRAIITDSGAKDAVAARIEAETAAATAALDGLCLDPTYRQAFDVVSTLLTKRNR
jgi:geranylgeranyl diphosphate synthase type I